MINNKEAQKYCKDYESIENYKEAMNDSTQVWHCHHRLETNFSDGTMRPKNAQLKYKELIALNMYWNRPANELIFLTKEEHEMLHRVLKSNIVYGSCKYDKKSYDKVRYEANKEELRAKGRCYYEVNKEKQKSYTRSHRKENNRASKISYFIKAHGIVNDLSSLPKKWTIEDIEHYKLRIREYEK